MRNLEDVAAYADIVGYSFVRDAADVDLLHRALLDRGCSFDSISLVLKIETARALDNLPELIARAASKQATCAVMIARGDLAIEVGWEKLAVVQEKSIWLCEAADVPVIWATQVLERLVKRGAPSRAEVTDAAMAVRAECIMLNKGPYLCEALRLLNEVLPEDADLPVKEDSLSCAPGRVPDVRPSRLLNAVITALMT